MDLSHFEKKLKDMRAELTAVGKAGEQAAETVELDQTRVGRLSRMDAMQNQAVSLEVQRRRATQLRQIEKALERLANDEFGFCSSCDEKINPKRLAIDPTTTLCIECATRAEH